MNRVQPWSSHDDLAVIAYQQVVRFGRWDDEWLGDLTGASAEELDEVRQNLADLHVIEPDGARSSGWRAVPPRVAMAKLVRPIEADVRRRAAYADRLRTQLQRLIPVHEAIQGLDAEDAVEVVPNEEALADLVDDELARCPAAVALAQPAADRPPLGTARLLESRRPDTCVRVVYQHVARYQLPSQGLVETGTDAGTEFRTLDELPLHMLVFDQATCVLMAGEEAVDRPGNPAPEEKRDVAVVLRHPVVVPVMAVIFQSLWDRAVPFVPADPQPPGIADEVRRAIVRLLATGAKDEVVARRLGISVRTCRRHIADLMEALGVASRFQAGIEARRRGLA
jgi:DNA-binding CsgD family transcriptional regulator